MPRGTSFEDHQIGRTFTHHWGRTIYASENAAFSTSMLAFNPLYFNREYAQSEGYRDEVINPMLVFGVVFGLSVEDLSEAGGPFLGANGLRFLADVHPGDTLYASSVVLDARESASRPDTGIVTWRTTGTNQAGAKVIEFERTNLVVKRTSTPNVIPAPSGYAEDFTVGQQFRHARTKTITDLDLAGFTLSVMNTAQGHFSEQFMADHEFGTRINFGGLTLSLVVGLATQDTIGQAIGEIGLDNVRFAVPVRAGDTIGAATEIKQIVPAETGKALVTFHHIGVNQDGARVCEVDRHVLVRSRSHH
ncbi:MaoC family dehydratase [Rhodococcus sp. NPDC059968]|uniref:MaoC family dehydratase n=1 Tax=Rhodococcus sp. NPDC059968 TaxID=3347017 RepID=UPI0036713C3B